MPQFVMENAREAAETETDFVRGFIECVIFQDQSCYPSKGFFAKKVQKEIEEGQADGTLPNDVGYADIAKESLISVRAFCEEFQIKAKAELEEAYVNGYTEHQAGIDFCFSHVGAGTGFWDRDELSVSSDPEEAARLKAIMRAEGTTPAEWSALLSQVKALESDIGQRLSDLAGRGEVNPYYGRDKKIHIDLY